MQKFKPWDSKLDAKYQGHQKSHISDLYVSKGCLFFTKYLLDKQVTTLYCYDIEKKILKRLTPDNYSIGNRVHEYGGLSYWISENYIYFSNIFDGNIYKLNLENHTISLLSNQKSRFADGNCFQDKFVCVKEEHIGSNKRVVNSIELWNERQFKTLHNTEDFYAYPRLSPDGNKLLWVSWNNPNMHWDQASLWVADIDLELGILKNIKKIVSQNESVFQPEWFDNNNILYSSDRNNWWNIYKYNIKNQTDKIIIKGNFEVGEALYSLGRRCYTIDNKKIYFIKNFNCDGVLCDDRLHSFNSQYNIATGDIVKYKNLIFAIGDNSFENKGIIEFNIKNSTSRKLNLFKDVNILSKKDISVANPISFFNKHAQKVHAFYYKPTNKNYNSKNPPPLIVMCHGGPIGSTAKGLNYKIQFWTNRGFAVVDVNYSGSTGYGRNYRKRLTGNWGILDVEDCYSAARYLISQNLVDKNKVIIRGSSAGGMLVLNALANYNIFTAGACYYPVTDLEYFEQIFNMHKYEAKYNTQLIGSYPENKDDYKLRSPINFANKIKTPVIFFHGLNDKIVPNKQSEDMVEKLRNNNVYSEYYTYSDEGHSFKQPKTLEDSASKELRFYLEVMVK